MVGRNTLAAAATAVLLVGGAATARAEPPAPPAPIVPPVQPANIGDLKTEATAYYDSGAYLTDLQLATAPAVAWIDEGGATDGSACGRVRHRRDRLVQLGGHPGQ